MPVTVMMPTLMLMRMLMLMLMPLNVDADVDVDALPGHAEFVVVSVLCLCVFLSLCVCFPVSLWSLRMYKHNEPATSQHTQSTANIPTHTNCPPPAARGCGAWATGWQRVT